MSTELLPIIDNPEPVEHTRILERYAYTTVWNMSDTLNYYAEEI